MNVNEMCMHVFCDCVDVEIDICNCILWVHGFVDKTKKEAQHALQDLQIDEMPPIAEILTKPSLMQRVHTDDAMALCIWSRGRQRKQDNVRNASI